MKINRFLVAIAVMLISLSGHAQSASSNTLREKLNEFIQSGEYQIPEPEKPYEGVTRYHFGMQFAVDGGLGETFAGPLLTPRLSELEKAMRTEAVNAKTVYFHDAREGFSPLSGVQFQLLDASEYLTRYRIQFESGENIRLISLKEAEGQYYALLLVFEQTIDKDKNGDMVLMNGWIYEVSGRKPGADPFLTHYSFSESEVQEAPEDMIVDLFIEKVRRTTDIFKRETQQGRMAAAVVLNKTCNDFKGTLTQQQYYDLLNEIQPLVDNEKNADLKNILAYSCYMLYKKSEIYVEEPPTGE